MIQPGSRSLQKIAVIGRGTAGSLAAANVSRLHPDNGHELHHIFDSRIPVIGVGEGSWPSLVQDLHRLTRLSHQAIQQRLNGTRKYGIAYEGWGCLDRDFCHYFSPQQVAYAYHLSADRLADLLHEGSRARHIDARVLDVTTVEDGARVEFEERGDGYMFLLDGRMSQLRSPDLVREPAELRDLFHIKSLPEHDKPEHPEMMHLVVRQHGEIPVLGWFMRPRDM